MIPEDETYYFEVDFSLNTMLDDEFCRYLNEFTAEIKTVLLEDESKTLIGKAKITQVLVTLVREHQYSLFDVLEESTSLYELGMIMFDYDRGGYDDPRYRKDFLKLFEKPPGRNNICLIEDLGLLPEYRGMGLGKKLIKQFVERFTTGCSVVALRAWPMQFRKRRPFDDEEWLSRLQLEDLEPDREIATSRLYLWLHSLDFSQPFQKEFFFMNPAVKNRKLDKISLDC